MRLSRAPIAMFALLPALAAAAEYRMGDYRAPTPAGLEGAVTVDTDEVKALTESGAAIAIDVMPAQRQPQTGTFLLPKPRLHLPDSPWLANVGTGELSPEMEAWFRQRLEQLAGWPNRKGLIFYCILDCWMSWNAAKRAISWGFGPVYWYRNGTDAWEMDGQVLVPATPEGPDLDQGRMERPH